MRVLLAAQQAAESFLAAVGCPHGEPARECASCASFVARVVRATEAEGFVDLHLEWERMETSEQAGEPEPPAMEEGR